MTTKASFYKEFVEESPDCSTMKLFQVERMNYQVYKNLKKGQSSGNQKDEKYRHVIAKKKMENVARHDYTRFMRYRSMSWYLAGCLLVIMVDNVYTRCYTTPPGLTILGSEYRKEYKLRYEQCARACYNDVSCMAFEYSKIERDCTFKARSLNGTFVEKPGSYFGLCLDRANPEDMRDLFYDHEFGGVSYASSSDVLNDVCAQFCLSQARSDQKPESLAYTWRPYNPRNLDSIEGECVCFETLHYVKVRYGSISSYLK